MELHRIAAAPREVEIRGKTYRATPLKLKAIGRIDAFLASKVEDPRKAARRFMEGLPLEMQQYMWDKAVEDAKSWPPSLLSDDGQAFTYLSQPEGIAVLVRLAIPDIGDDEAEELAATMTMDEVGKLMSLIYPNQAAPPVSPDPGGDESDPKAGPAAGATTSA